ncbi:MAG TPA: sulfatase-like hydrolase/transferase [Casimicrobiaceae bacterium]|nr:sulfatase-like hydrolase/transferase [Casimicrobiaceae bacterium]
MTTRGNAHNVLVIMSDEHNPKYLSVGGHPYVLTPNLDALAARGTRFTSAYTTCPICVPARAAFAVGRYVHEIGFWDNGDAYDGSVPSWHHALRAAGHRVVSIGKLHFRGRAGDDHGFTQEIVPMHVVEGLGDVKGMVRDDIPVRKGGDKMAKYAGPGESTYTVYDRDIAARAQIWLHEEATRDGGKPWVLFVSFVAPHFPLTAPPEWYYRYARMNLPLPKQYRAHERPRHPFVDEYARVVDYDTHFASEDDVRRALAGYAGLVSSMDENVGKVLRALSDAGLTDNTRIIYTSDHGDNTGARGLWGKSTLYEESAGVPLIAAGPGIPEGRVVDTPVSHVDCAPAILETAAAKPLGPLSGDSLFDIAQGVTPKRVVLCEYHAIGSKTGGFMLRDGCYKYCYYVGAPPQLFDLERDPEELVDLATDAAHRATLAACEAKLRAMLDPEAVDRRAKMRQREQVDAYGGREKALARGDLGFTPAPGTRAEMD